MFVISVLFLEQIEEKNSIILTPVLIPSPEQNARLIVQKKNKLANRYNKWNEDIKEKFTSRWEILKIRCDSAWC